MSFDLVRTVNFPQAAFQYVPTEVLGGNAIEDFATLGGILSDLKHLWHAKGPFLEVRNTSGRKVGSWTFGGILKDSNTKIIAVDELKRPHKRLPLLVVALECTISGGLVCVFDIFGSKVLRVVQVREQITSLHVIDSGCENSVLPEPSPLRYFDGIVAVGMSGGNVYLLDICRQICENGIHNVDSNIRDELNPCPMIILNKEHINDIKKYVERSVDREEHLAIHLNMIVNPSTEHFTLKGEKGEDRVHVNRLEAEVSSLFYSSQIASLLVGYNFGAFQLWDLRSLELVYTSPVCEEHIPVIYFTVQEPADDPKAYCYIWVSYSHNLMFNSGLPFAVMYSFYYENKSYVNGYGNLYEDFEHCSIRFQIELGETETPSYNSRVKGGSCIGMQSLNRYPINKDLNSLSLCLISWLVWNSHKEVNTFVLVFDLNQWYKEQMPRTPNWSHCSNYIIKHSLRNQIVLNVKLDQKSLSQFIGIQRLEEHFCPTALSFDLWCITNNSILKVHNKGLQQAFLDKIVNDQHLSLVRPDDYFEQISNLGLVPLFCEIHLSNSMDVEYHREILLNVALEQKLIGWLCKCTSKLANNAFNASGLAIYNILNWAFERAITLKNSCDKYCVSLFDYSGTKLDNNTITILNSSTGQIRNICSLYRYVSSKLIHFVSDKEVLLEEQRSLENVVVYFEVLLWMVNIGLLPECQMKNCQNYDDSFTSAPYLVNDLTQYYNRKRAQLQMASHDTFVEKDCLLYIDNLINMKGGAEIQRQHWQEDGGSGLYPPPSLQSVLRTYFLDGLDLISKHCLVTYTLLDIAMTVDENNKVIKLLLKFPQIFDLSQSNIKIVQAFWHLDHDDYETALEYILDPCVLTEDLHRWHHSVMMRSLLLQEQPSLALLYLQIRKPAIQDEKDLLTVISLLISKNMLDEAFKFRQQHQSPNEHALLLHIFNECNKNELLHSLLYRRLNNGEEEAFFKYLHSTKNPRCEDLKVFYYLLRSRFLEAFDSYSSNKRKKPENQGLIGQRDATTADNIVKMFKTLLPEVNKTLVELVRKERTNLWKEVRKPTPLSVFVHNARDQVQYKSSVIFAALAKAKQTFNETVNETRVNNDVITEETPFLRTPTAFRSVSNAGTPLMKYKVIEQNEQGIEYGPSPCKKLKLSPRTSKTSPIKSRNISLSAIQSKLSTPIIRRKRLSTEPSNTTTALPQSILKGSSATRTFLDDSILDENTSANMSLQLECENSVRRSRLALTPRKPLSRTPLKSHVKFDDLRYSSSSNEQNSKNDSTLHQLIPERSRSQSVNSEASTVDEIYYSPNNSPEGTADSQNPIPDVVEEKIKTKSLSPFKDNLSFNETVTDDDVFIEDQLKKRIETTKIPVEDNDLSTNRLTFQSPRSRRSYKRSFGESPVPVRSSPRLAKKTPREENEDSSFLETTINKSESILKPSPSVAVQKLRGRKSLSRAVLENNAFSKLKSENLEDRSIWEPKSSASSLNTTANDSESEVDTDHSHNTSLEELLAKYRTSALGSDNSINKNDSLLSDSGKTIDRFKDGEVVSKITEVINIETHMENVRKRDTRELVSSKKTREEYHSKKVEELEQDKLPVLGNENPVNVNIFDEVTQEFNANLGRNIEDDTKSETEVSEVSEKQESLNREENDDKTQERHEEINVYEDLSSGSEDVREVLKQFGNKNYEDKAYADISFSTSASYYQSEKRDELMPENLMDSGESNSNEYSPKSPQAEHVYDNDIDMEELYDDIPASERAFVNSDVIEIGTSSEEEDKSTDENTRSSSSSSSEETSYSSKDESNDNYVMIAFEDNLNERADEPKRTEEHQLSDEENSINKDYIPEKATKDKNIGEDRQTEHDLDKDLENKNIVLEESSKSSCDDDHASAYIEQQFEFDQKEIAAALKMIQENTVAEEQVIGADDEHMDSLILEEQSPEKDTQNPLEPKIVKFEDTKESLPVAVIEEQEVIESDRALKENPQESEAKELIIKELSEEDKDTSQDKEKVQSNTDEPDNEATSLKQSKSLQCTLGVNDSPIESPITDSTINEKETLIPTVKESRSIQCTLGDNDFVMDSPVKDDKDDHIVPLTNETKNTDLEVKGTPMFPEKQSKSLQCTLGENDSLLDTSIDDTSVFLKDNESMDLSEEAPVISDNKDKYVNLMEKEATVCPPTQTRSLQCTLGVNDYILESSADDSSVFVKSDENIAVIDHIASDNINEDLSEKGPAVSTSLQCTLEDGDSIMKTAEKDDIAASHVKDFLRDEETTPIKLKTVKKTYTGRKTSEASGAIDSELTPKIVASLTKRTYSRKEMGVSNKLSDATSSQTGTQEKSGDQLQNDETEVPVEETKNEELEEIIEAKIESIVPMDIEENKISDIEIKDKDDVVKETPDSTEQIPPKEQDVEKHGSQITNDENTEEDTETIENKDHSEHKEEETPKAAPAMRVTRRKSVLLAQQDETPNSTSEKAVGSISGDVTRSQETKEQSSEIPSEISVSQATSSQTTISLTPSSRRVTRSSQLSDSLFDATFVTELPVVRAEIDIMESSVIDSNTKVRIDRDVLETDEEIEEKKSAEDKPGPSKIRTRRSSKDNSKNEPSASQQSVPYAVPKKRARSASVDQPLTSTKKRSIRSKSIDLDDLKDPSIASKIDLKVMLTPIQEQPGPSTENDVPEDEAQKHGTKAYSDVGAYTTSRRLTRRQASMLKSIGKVEKEMKKMHGAKEIDPYLLDKTEFAGKLDPDESKVYEPPSPSNSSGTLSRHTRSASVLSDIPGTPKRGSRAKSEHVDSPVSGIKTRLRRQSTDTMSVTSEQSDSPSPSKRVKKKNDESDSQPVKRERSRASSVSSSKSAASDKTESSVRTTRSRRIYSAKSELSEIKEEKDNEMGESAVDTSVIKRRGRKKKE